MHATKLAITDFLIDKANLHTDVTALSKLFDEWKVDYSNSGGGFHKNLDIHRIVTNKHIATLKAEVDGKIVAFAWIRKDSEDTQIHLVHVNKKHRRKGIATALYKHAITNLNANQIEITYQRAINNLQLWRSLGFKCLTAKINEGYTMLDLCLVSTKCQTHSPLAVPLERSSIVKYMQFFSQNRSANTNSKPYLFE